MRRHMLIGFVMAWGLLALLASLSLLPGDQVVLADEAVLAEPSPRPPLDSTPEPKPRDRDDDHDDHDEVVAPAPGRITGTVIDQSTGAPAPGVLVNVGGLMVRSDGNGNYDVAGLPPGNYGVLLMFSVGDEMPSQGLRTVDLQAGTTAVVHLAFHRPQATLPTPEPFAPTPEPFAPTPEPFAPTPEPFAPTALPAPSAEAAAPPADSVALAPAPERIADVTPARLPQTGTLAGTWLWVSCAACLLLIGMLLQSQR